MLKRLRKNAAVRTFIGGCLYYSGLAPYLRWRGRQKPGRLLILTYHRANGSGLRGQLAYLKRHYRVLPLESALEELYAPRAEQPRPDPRQVVAVTFDDGYQDNYTDLFPVARDLGVPVTIFLVPGYIESGDTFWWLAAKTLVRQSDASIVSWGDRIFRLDDPIQRANLVRLIDSRLRYASAVASREAILASARLALGLPLAESASGAFDSADDRDARPLTWEQIAEMEASGWVTFGAHTQRHPVLACLRDPAEVASEVTDCRVALEDRLGHPVRLFAYPIGLPEHIGEVAPEAAKRAGYSWIFSNQTGSNTTSSDPSYLRRIGAESSDHWLVLALRVAGVRAPGLLFSPDSSTKIPSPRTAVPQSLSQGQRVTEVAREESLADPSEESELTGLITGSPSAHTPTTSQP